MLTFIVGFVILIFSIILHEVAHGWVADRLGDPTPRLSGRLTLNPISHIDPFMSVLLPLFLILSGTSVVFGAAKPVPIDPYNFRQGRKDMGLVGLAGPATNILLAVIATLIFKTLPLFPFPSLPSLAAPLLSFVVIYNIFLAALNLVPIPPLDGSRVLGAILPEKQAKTLDALEPYGLFIIIFLLFFPIGGFSLGRLVSSVASFWLRLLGF